MGGKDDKDHKIGRQCYNRNAGRVQRNMFSYRGLTLLIPCRFLTGFTVENIKYARGVKNTFFRFYFCYYHPILVMFTRHFLLILHIFPYILT